MGRDYSVYGSSRPSNGGESDDVHSSSNARALLFGKDGKKVPSEWTLGSIATAADQRH